MTKTKSMRITKDMARDAANKMATKVYSGKLDACKKALDSIIEAYFAKLIPAPVLACAKEFPDLFYVSRRVCVALYNPEKGYYTGCIYGNIGFDVPYGAQQLELPKKDYDKVKEVYRKLSSTQDAYNDFETSMYDALVTLKTTKAVSEQLPEALEYLNIPEPTALPAPIYNNLRTLLRCAQ